mgnify:CR=1 FL=1
MKIKSIRDVKISKKLMILGAVSILGLFLMGKESIATARQIDQVGAELNDVWMNAVIAAEELNTVTSDYRITESRHAITTDPELMGALEQDMLELEQDIESRFQEYKQLPTLEADQMIMDRAYQAWQQYLECSKELVEISKGDDREKATEMMMGEAQQRFDETSGLFLEAVDYNKDTAMQARDDAGRLYDRLSRVKLVVIGAVSLIVISLILSLIRSIKEPSEKLADAAWRAGNGNLDTFLEYESEDEIGALTRAMNEIIRDETRMFQEIGSRNYEVKSECEQAYRGDFAPVLYAFASLQSQLKVQESQHQEELLRQKEHYEKELAALKIQISQMEKETEKHEEK